MEVGVEYSCCCSKTKFLKNKKNIKNHKNVFNFILFVFIGILHTLNPTLAPLAHLFLAFSSTYLLLTSNPHKVYQPTH